MQALAFFSPIRDAGRRVRSAAMVCLAAVVLAGCASGVIQRGGQPPNIVDSGVISARPSTVSIAQERRIGARAHPLLVSAYGGEFENPRLNRKIADIVRRLEAQTDSGSFEYRVTILNSPAINAFALPGGFIYVTRGLLALANTESELASVLAHEMAHVLARHAVERERATRTTIAASQNLASLMRNAEASEAVLQNARGYLAQFSRQQEFEADAIGLKLASSAGYDPMAAATLLSSMAEQSDLRARRFFASADADEVDFLSGHPAPPDRIAAVIRDARALEGDRPSATRDRVTYLRAIDGLLYGDDPEEGFVRGRSYLHPGLRLAFEVPEGFRIDNRSDAVNALAEDGSLVRFDGESIDPSASMADYLADVWSDGIEVRDVQTLVINGKPAITARAEAKGWSFRLAAVRWSSNRVFRMLFATRNLNSARDASFIAAARSIREISVEEARDAQPLVVRAYRVRGADTVASLAQTLPFEDNREERFRVLNGLRANERLKPGSWVKIIGN